MREKILSDVDSFDSELSCSWQTSGNYFNPPEYCELEKNPEDEYCSVHEKLSRKMTEHEELNPSQ